MSAAVSIRLLLVDDHGVITEGLSMLLSRFADFEIVGTASGGAEAVRRVADLHPDVVLMDLSMPEVNGVEATAQIRRDHPDVQILALTAFLEQQLVTDAVGAGASGYLLKSTGGEELAAAIRTVAAGGSVLSAEALPLLAAPSNPIGDDLTPRELGVLQLIVHGMSNKQIAAELGISPGTVRIHVSNILTKLEVENRTAAAYLARNSGLVRAAKLDGTDEQS